MLHLSCLCMAVMAFSAPAPVRFDSEIIPILTKAGCNSGACHGAAAGRGGFRLSLFGGNPAQDHETIVHEFEGRRVNLAHPERSLMLRKPTEQLDHGGGLVLDQKSADRVRDWIRAGAPRGPTRKLTSFQVEPAHQLCNQSPAKVPLKATAIFDHGVPEDVTDWTLFSATDPSSIQIGDDHVARITRRGQHVVIARFLDRVVALQFTVPLSDTSVDLSSEPRAGFIDEEILQLLSQLRLPVSPPASDAAWLRRVSLDLTGRLPDPERVNSFLSDRSPDKRSRFVDALLWSDAFADYWTLRFAKLLGMHSLPNEKQALATYSHWLRREIAQGTPLDELARQLLTATGDSHLVGPANFGRMAADPREHADLVGQFFVGVRLGCANCHNHPLDKWTQDDYHGLAAIFARLDRGRHVRLTSIGDVTNPRTKQFAPPRIPGVGDLPRDGDHRHEVVKWVTSTEHNYFARVTVNRVWQAMFGRGLVEPVDDLRDTNPATHPRLLALLTSDFIGSGYRIRHTLKQIALSHAYSRSTAIVQGNESDDRFYSRAYPRRLEPEVLVDAISDVTGVAEQFEGHEATRAVMVIDPSVPAGPLDALGRCRTANACGERTNGTVTLPTYLHLLNGEVINKKLADPRGHLSQMIAAGSSNEEIVSQFYIRGLGRHATEDELRQWTFRLSAGDAQERGRRLEDFLWALLNSREFLESP